MHTSSSAKNVLPGSDRRTWISLGVVDVQPILPRHADLESDLLNLLQGLPAKQLQSIQQIEDCIQPRLPGLVGAFE